MRDEAAFESGFQDGLTQARRVLGRGVLALFVALRVYVLIAIPVYVLIAIPIVAYAFIHALSMPQ